MTPVKFFVEFQGVKEDIMVWVTHDVDHSGGNFFEGLGGVFRVHCWDEVYVVVDYAVDFDSPAGGATKTDKLVI